MEPDFYDQMIQPDCLSNVTGQKEKAFRAGVTTGYTKKNTQINSEEVTKNESLHTDGLLVGIGINNEEEYNQIIKESEERQRISLKSFKFGTPYGMGNHLIKNKLVDYTKSDADMITKLVEALAGEEENNA